MVSLLDEIDNLTRDDIFALYDMIKEKMPNLMNLSLAQKQKWKLTPRLGEHRIPQNL